MNRLFFTIGIILFLTSKFSFSQSENKKSVTDLNKENLKGKVKEYKQTYFNASEKFGEIVKGERAASKEGMDNRIIKFSEAGKFKEVLMYSVDGGLLKSISLNEKIIGYNSYHSNGTLITKIMYESDSLGREIEQITYDFAGKVTSKCTFEYDANGNQTEINFFNEDGKLNTKVINIFDEKNNLLEKSILQKNKIISSSVYKYDNKGNEIEEIKNQKSPPLKITKTSSYEFDSNGNWITRTNYSNSVVNSILVREFRYYGDTLPPLKGDFFVAKESISNQQSNSQSNQSSNSSTSNSDPCNDVELLGLYYNDEIPGVKYWVVKIRNKANYAKNVTVEFKNNYGEIEKVNFKISAGDLISGQLKVAESRDRKPLDVRFSSCL